jgi:hypothetical protein
MIGWYVLAGIGRSFMYLSMNSASKYGIIYLSEGTKSKLKGMLQRLAAILEAILAGYHVAGKYKNHPKQYLWK